jgi:Rod binding domain-containing protein
MPWQPENSMGQTASDFAAALKLWKERLFKDFGDADKEEEASDEVEHVEAQLLKDTSGVAKTTQLPQIEEDKLKQTAYEFEAMLMTQLFQTLRKTVEPSGLFGYNQTARSTYEYLLDQSLFQQAAASGHTWGLASRLEESWKNLQLRAKTSINNN